MRTINVIESIFFAALERAEPADRLAYLDEACQGDAELRRAVERMLAAAPKVGDFLQAPAPGLPATAEHPPLAEKPGTVIGPYKLLQELGEGGFGVVFLAEQAEPVRRKVALKVIKPGMDSRQVVARFEQERQALALMDHPNIARVFDGGATDSGRPFFVMEYVKGTPITAFCDEHKLTPRQRLELFVGVCEAIQHAHQKGVIHRDIKPSNVLVALCDGKPVAKVIDFGVAKAIAEPLTDKTLFTRHGQVIGTLEYMSPEQATLDQHDVDTRSDVYALGVLLYELLTGTTPLEKEKLRSAGFAEMLRLIREEEAVRPSVRLSGSGHGLPMLAAFRGTESAKLPRLVRGELDWIAMKALEKDRGRRYGTATALAADVQRYLKDEAVEACPPSLAYRAGKFARKYRAALTLAATAAALLLLGTVVSGWQAVRAWRAEQDALQMADSAHDAQMRADHEAKVARRERDAVRAARAELRRSHYAATMNLISAAWKADNVARTRELLAELRPGPGEDDLRGFEWHHWDRLAHAERRSLPLGDDVFGLGVTFSGDGRRVAYLRVVDRGNLPPDGPPRFPDVTGQIVVRDTAAGQVVFTTPNVKSVGGSVGFSLSHDGRLLACSTRRAADGEKGTVVLWDVTAGREIVGDSSNPPSLLENNRAAVLSRDGKFLAATEVTVDPETRRRGQSSAVRVWPVADLKKEPLVFTRADDGRVPSVAFSPDGKRIAGLIGPSFRIPQVRGSVVQLWDASTGKLLGKTDLPDEVNQVAFTPDGQHLVGVGTIPGDQRYTYLWDATGDEPKLLRKTPLKSHDGANPRSEFALSPDGKRMAVWSLTDEPVRIVDTATGAERQTIKPLFTARAAAFSADGTKVFTVTGLGRLFGSVDRRQTVVTLQEWDVTPDPPVIPGAPPRPAVGPVVVWSQDKQRQVVYQRRPREKDGAEDRLWVRVRDRDGKEIAAFKGHTDYVTDLKFSPNGRFVFSMAGSPRQMCVWEADTGTLRLNAKVPLPSLRFVPADGSLLHLPGEGHGRIVRFDDLTEVFRVPGNAVVYFSPDGKRVISVTGGRFPLFPGQPANAPQAEKPAEKTEITLWDVETGKALRTDPLPDIGPVSAATRVKFSADGRWYTVAGVQGRRSIDGLRLAVYDAGTGQERGPGLPILASSFSMQLHFSPDGSKLLVNSRTRSQASRLEGPEVYDVATGKRAYRLEGHTGVVTDVAFSPDGRRIATAAGDAARQKTTVRVWDAGTGRELLALESAVTPTRAVPEGFNRGESRLAFSPDGHRLTLRNAGLASGVNRIATWDATPLPDAKP